MPDRSLAVTARFSTFHCATFIRMKRLVIALLLTALPLWAQLDGFSREQLLKYTANNPFDRMPDGRPKIPQKYIDALNTASSEMLWGPLAWRRLPQSMDPKGDDPKGTLKGTGP